MTKEQKFHSNRIMFVLLGDDLRVAPVRTTMSHKEWFAARPELDIDYEKVVRGYYGAGILHLYTGGDNFEAPTMCNRYKELANEFGASQIYLGAIKGEIGKPWEPVHIIYP